MKRILAIAVLVAVTPACKRGAREVDVYTSVDVVFSEPIFKAFEHESGITVRAVFDTEETKSTGVINRLIAETQHPQADVFWANDPVRPFLLVKRSLAEPYLSPSASDIPATLPRTGPGRISPQGRAYEQPADDDSGQPPRHFRPRELLRPVITSQ